MQAAAALPFSARLPDELFGPALKVQGDAGDDVICHRAECDASTELGQLQRPVQNHDFDGQDLQPCAGATSSG